jgi:acetyl esterase/lipase
MKKILLIILMAMICLPAYAQRGDDDNLPKGKVYVYKQANGINREMEIYFPQGKKASQKPVAGIILFHGGGWGGGSREAFSYQCNYFASRGMVAATVTYRLRTKDDRAAMKDGQSSKRVCIPDVKSAIRWFKQHAKELGVDPRRIVAGGGSAGGHISLLGTTNPGLNDPNDPKGIDTSVAAYVLFNPALSKSDAKDPDVDFMQHLKADFGPAIVFFGSEDKWMVNGWTPAATKMKSLGITSVDMRIAEGESHAFFNKQPWKDITLIAADRFLKKLGYIKGEPTLQMPKTGEKLVVKR